MQEDFKDAKLIIIDEYSMVGKLMLAHIDRRFRDIFSIVTELFGNISILLVGDIRKLPPVCDRALFVSLEKESPMQVCGGAAYAGFDKAITLSQIFRQAGNEQAGYRDALERLSEGLSTRNDWNLFQTRDWSLFSPQEMESFKYALRLFPIKVNADAFNSKRLIDLGKPITRISSKNNCDTASNASSDHAKGLVKVLLLSIGARVMLRSNLHTQSGLVNGAMGTIVDILYGPGCKSPTDMPLAVMVDFDNYMGSPFRQNSMVVPIPPQTSSWKSATGISCSRTQIPIVLCWAITIHKSQGLTLDTAIVDIGDKESLGLTFVALSRTRKLTDLAFSPMFTFERLQKIKKCVGLKWRMLVEERLHNMSTTTI